MPDGNGDYVLGRLKENPVTKEIPVIVLTGHRDKCLERKMYNLGADHFFNKPVQWDELWSALQIYIERPRHETESRSFENYIGGTR
jgi:response regulator RpfG family c-di-GMP phosphodiesterase